METGGAAIGTRQRPSEAKEDASSGLKRHIGPIGLLFAGVGSVIGSGWLFGALNASIIAGPAAIISWARLPLAPARPADARAGRGERRGISPQQG
jgi:hypothetical protein